jgi:hypothetical protein
MPQIRSSNCRALQNINKQLVEQGPKENSRTILDQ